MAEASPSDAQLLERARSGDVEAFGRLVERHQDYVYNGVLHMVGDRQDADDLAQEVFLRAYEGLDGFEGRSQFSTWLYGILLNTVRGFWRRRGRVDVLSTDAAREDESRPDFQMEADTDGPLHTAVRGERVRAVQRAIGELDEIMREIIVLRDIQGLSYEELEEVLEVPSGTVKSRLYRARQQLKDKLTPFWASQK